MLRPLEALLEATQGNALHRQGVFRPWKGLGSLLSQGGQQSKGTAKRQRRRRAAGVGGGLGDMLGLVERMSVRTSGAAGELGVALDRLDGHALSLLQNGPLGYLLR